MKIVFMGSSDFSIPSLKELISAGHEILALVCQPDKPNGRGNKIEFSNIKKFALEKNIKVLQYHKILLLFFLHISTKSDTKLSQVM